MHVRCLEVFFSTLFSEMFNGQPVRTRLTHNSVAALHQNSAVHKTARALLIYANAYANMRIFFLFGVVVDAQG